jgi:putative endopeptidase
VQVMFAGDSKRAAQEMVAAISDAFNEELNKLTWMDDDTKARAREKLKTLAFHIGYPNAWKKYTFKVDRKSFAGNAVAASRWASDWELSRIGKPVDRQEWLMPPQIVNAYYNPTKNEMVFPAGILQPPFFSAKAGVAVNLGAIGMVIGHELIHGYDDEGSQFAPDGNLKKWWSDEARTKFEAQAQCVEKQYSKYEALPGVKLDGKLTLGENLADLGGVTLGFAAYHRLRDAAPDTVVADGFTEDQQFFLGVGQIWCVNQRDEIARQLAKTDPHSPGRYRVNGPLSNLPEFHKAFGCKQGQKMRPPTAELCKVW